MAQKRKRFDVQVTPEDIEKAKQNDSMRCVVVQAIARTIPDATRIDVDLQDIRLTRNGERLRYQTPYTVQGYIVAFDAGDDIEPFSFRMQAPQSLRRRKRTDAGKAVHRAEAAAVRAPKRKQKAATAEVATVKDAYKDAAQTVTVPGARPPRRTYRTATRHYGHRVLRWNQDAE